MFRTHFTILLFLVALPSCSLIIDTNPDGVIDAGGTAGRSGSSPNTNGAAGSSNQRTGVGTLGGTVGSSDRPGTTTSTSIAGTSSALGGASATTETASPGTSGGFSAVGLPGGTAGLGTISSVIVGGTGNGGVSQVFGGNTAISGTTTSGGTLATGGSLATGGAAGGTLATGGSLGTGGAAGGTLATGGSLGTGGTTSGTSGPCTAGSQKCSNNVPQLCTNAGVWQDQTTCTGSTPTCKGGSCVCTSGHLRCKNDGVTPQFCTAETVWQDRAACSGATPVCNGAGVCGECKVGTKKCEGTTPYTCSDAGTWKARTKCSGSTPFCSAGICTATCPGNGGPSMKLLPEGYCIDTTEVSREQYYTWTASNPVATAASQISECAWNGSFVPETDASNNWPPTGNFKAPIVLIDWCDAYAFCAAVGKRLCGKIGGGPFLYSDETANPYTSEWISACSSHGSNDYTYGDTFVEGACNILSSGMKSIATSPQCQPPTSDYGGVYDLSGNAEEWENNCTPGEGMNAACTSRGGSYTFWNEQSSCTSTYAVERSTKSSTIGFRCCSS